MSTPSRYIGTPVTTEQLRDMIAKSWPQLSVTVEFWPGAGRRIRDTIPERRYTLRTDAMIVLLSQPMTAAASGLAGVRKMVVELREIFGETPLPGGLSWEELDEFARVADSRNLELAVTDEPPRGTGATYRLAEIPALLEKHRAWLDQNAEGA